MKLDEQLFITLSSKYDELNVQRASALGGLNMMVIDTPALSERSEPYWPDWMLNLLIGIPASFLVGLGLAFLRKIWREPFPLASPPAETRER